MSENLLELNDVTVSFMARRGGTKTPINAADHVSLSVRRGEIFGLVGESGSGKSTLARLIVGLNSAASGTVVFDGEVLANKKRPRALRRQIQMVFQDPYSSLDPSMTVRQQLTEILKVHDAVSGSQRKAHCEQVFAQVELSPTLLSARPRQMSGGQRQRVAIARALLLSPELLVADEPVSALDVSIQAGIIQLFADLRTRLGVTIFFIAHDLAVVRHLCDRVAVMYMGKIVEEGVTSELFANPRHPYTRALLDSIPRLQPEAHEEIVAPEGEPPSLARLPSGCRFRSRCPFATEKCALEEPPLIDVTSSPDGSLHRAACHYANELEAYVGRSSTV
jgi:peptide/nickel transport system ATP-binding protein/oligopeptide transport system ATP-binding protein